MAYLEPPAFTRHVVNPLVSRLQTGGVATLTVPAGTWMQSGGRRGKHTEKLGYILAEMQHLQRTYPGCTW